MIVDNTQCLELSSVFCVRWSAWDDPFLVGAVMTRQDFNMDTCCGFRCMWVLWEDAAAESFPLSHFVEHAARFSASTVILRESYDYKNSNMGHLLQ